LGGGERQSLPLFLDIPVQSRSNAVGYSNGPTVYLYLFHQPILDQYQHSDPIFYHFHCSANIGHYFHQKTAWASAEISQRNFDIGVSESKEKQSLPID